MLTKIQQAKIDNLWDKFYSGGIANPMDAMEQINKTNPESCRRNGWLNA